MYTTVLVFVYTGCLDMEVSLHLNHFLISRQAPEAADVLGHSEGRSEHGGERGHKLPHLMVGQL